MRSALTSLFLVICAAQVALVPLRSRLTVVAHGPAGLHIEGRSAEVSVDDETSALVFRAPIAALDSGIALRNSHLREALEADKFPLATLRVPRAIPPEGLIDADLTLHGETHPVTVRYRTVHAEGLTRAIGSLRLDVRDFGIRPPSYLGVTDGVAGQNSIAVRMPSPAVETHRRRCCRDREEDSAAPSHPECLDDLLRSPGRRRRMCDVEVHD